LLSELNLLCGDKTRSIFSTGKGTLIEFQTRHMIE
jgi:hypothetical protein